MNNHEKIVLNPITHSVRASQAVLQYGLGAMVDFSDQTLVTSSPEYWSNKKRIFDDRFSKALDVDYFALPTDVAYMRFPEWYFCPKCRIFQPLKKWISEYQKTPKRNNASDDEYMVKHMQCPKCRQDLVVARIVTVCERGHLNDFPWVAWVHTRSKKQRCSRPSLKFKTGASGTEGLEGLTIECSCGARANLKSAFDKDIFEKLEIESGTPFKCPGHHPFNHTQETCSCYPRTVQRGASSVYFPVVYSSLVIPPYADKLNIKIENSHAYEDCMTIINDEEPEDRPSIIKKKLGKWSEKIANEIGTLKTDVEKILRNKWLNFEQQNADVGSVQYRIEEYMALSGEISTPKSSWGDFSREALPIEEYGLPYIKSISLINKVRVVNALIGFSRINPVSGMNDNGFVCLSTKKLRIWASKSLAPSAS